MVKNMGNKHRTLRKVSERSKQFDSSVRNFLQSHANLIVALVIVGILIRLHTIWLLGGLVITGVLGYFAGISIGLMSSFVLSGIGFYLWITHGLPDSSHVVLDTISYWCNVWLACQYRREKKVQQNGHHDQVMSWAVANEIRNSLAAIRFVLFPIQENASDTNIDRVTAEIVKIERYFEEIESQNSRPRN